MSLIRLGLLRPVVVRLVIGVELEAGVEVVVLEGVAGVALAAGEGLAVGEDPAGSAGAR
jgi:hypothetical protein